MKNVEIDTVEWRMFWKIDQSQTNLCSHLTTSEPSISSFSTGHGEVDALPGPVVVVLADQRVDEAGLVHLRTTHDQKAGTRIPDDITS